MGRPSVYPTGTTIYYPEECENGYTLFSAPELGVNLIDMNGKVVRHWKNMYGFPPKILPGGHMIASLATRPAANGYQDQEDLTMVDWDGNIEWKFDRNQFIKDPDGERWMARQHHDFQVEGNPVGYWVPGMEMSPDFKKMLILTHNDVRKPKISPQLLLEDRLIEIDREGNIVWEWCMLDHFNEFDLDETIKGAMFRNPNTQEAGPEGQGDIFHVNCASYLGPNKWFDGGDERFKPDNIILDSREANIMWIVDHDTGKVVWQVGPDFTRTRELRIFGTVVGPHHTHMIPAGLPGEGNIMVYDNGGWAGYGAPNQFSKIGLKVTRRDSSRVVEFDPTTLEIVWECSGEPQGSGGGFNFNGNYFYSPLTSDAQRLPNGNTLICEGCSAILREVTPENKIVWEYVFPDVGMSLLYRAYRIPYDWIPQLDEPAEVEVSRIDNTTYHLEGSAQSEYESTAVTVEGAHAFNDEMAHCVEGLE